MKFKYSAFTENTPEMREWLESIGYKNFYNKYDGDTICTVFDSSYDCRNYKIGQTLFSVYLKMIEPIDCRSNPQLFKALTSVRTDSDYMQWFVITRYNEAKNQIVDEWRLCNTNNFDIDSMPYASIISHHKAIPEELAEHFKIADP